MQTVSKILGVILACLVLFLVVARVNGFEPNQRRPGLWLTGNLVTAPVTDWSFTDDVPNLKIQTNTWYGIPHSVTINCVSYRGQLYVDSVYKAGVTYPHGRGWNENVARDPHVRIKIGNQLFDRTLARVTDPDEAAAVNHAKMTKYPDLKVPPGGTLVFFHVLDR